MSSSFNGTIFGCRLQSGSISLVSCSSLSADAYCSAQLAQRTDKQNKERSWRSFWRQSKESTVDSWPICFILKEKCRRREPLAVGQSRFGRAYRHVAETTEAAESKKQGSGRRGRRGRSEGRPIGNASACPRFGLQSLLPLNAFFSLPHNHDELTTNGLCHQRLQMRTDRKGAPTARIE